MKYLHTAEIAQMLRRHLKEAFPKVKFSVKKSGGGIAVTYTEAAIDESVRKLARLYNGEGFDGSIDLAYSINAYVKDGKIVGTRSSGTEDSRGYVAPWDDAVEGAELVANCNTYVNAQIDRY